MQPWSILETVKRVAAGMVSPAGAVRSCLDAIDADRTNAVVTRRDADVLAEAGQLGRELASGSAGRVAGVPFTVKDTLAARGLPATAGSRLLRDRRPADDAPVVTMLRRAGALLIGKTNCAEFALSPVAGNALFGMTVNPRAGNRTPGGSSAGCAAAVAGGLVPLSIGTDYGGSVRFPAYCTGVVGFRPGLGGIACAGQVPGAPAGSPRAFFSVPGLLTRSIDDLALVLDVLLNVDPSAEPKGMPADAGLRCGLLRGEGTQTIDADVLRALDDAASTVAASGLAVDELDIAILRDCEPVFAALRATDDLADLHHLALRRESELSAPMRAVLSRTRGPAGATPAAMWEARQGVVDSVADATEHHAVLLMPVATAPPPPAQDIDSIDGAMLDALFRVLAPSRAITLLGLPSASVPTRVHVDGIPLGVQVVGRRGREVDLLRVARIIEAGR